MVDVKKEEETDESRMQYRYKTGSTEEQAENDDSLSKYLKEAEAEPNNASAHNNLGVALFNLGRHAESVKSFDRAYITSLMLISLPPLCCLLLIW